MDRLGVLNSPTRTSRKQAKNVLIMTGGRHAYMVGRSKKIVRSLDGKFKKSGFKDKTYRELLKLGEK